MAFANSFLTDTFPAPAGTLELTCSADSLVALRAAVDIGAEWIHLDYRRQEGANGLTAGHLDNPALVRGIRYARDKGCKIVLNLDIQLPASTWIEWRAVIDRAAQLRIDAIELSDPALLLYAANRCPEMQRHYVMPETEFNCNAIAFVQRQFGISRIVLPRVVTLAQITLIAKHTKARLLVTGFGRHCAIIDTGKVRPFSSNTDSADASIGDMPPAGCALTETAANDSCYVLDLPPDTGALPLLPELTALGVCAIRVDAANYSLPHLTQVIRIWREAVNECLENIDRYSVRPSWITGLNSRAKDSKRLWYPRRELMSTLI